MSDGSTFVTARAAPVNAGMMLSRIARPKRQSLPDTPSTVFCSMVPAVLEFARSQMTVPVSLRRWFVFHFIADMIFAVPLLLAPAVFLRALGWTNIDPVTARMVGAALAGIGIESFLCRNDGIETFRSMLRLKCIWSGAALAGLAFSIAQGAPPFAWVVLVIFVGFAALWNTYRLKLRAGANHRSGAAL